VRQPWARWHAARATIDRNFELRALRSDAKIVVPALFMVGDRDLTLGLMGMDAVLARAHQLVPNLRAFHFPAADIGRNRSAPRRSTPMITFLKATA
jgi:hypothetical protein